MSDSIRNKVLKLADKFKNLPHDGFRPSDAVQYPMHPMLQWKQYGEAADGLMEMVLDDDVGQPDSVRLVAAVPFSPLHTTGSQ